jgi:hypothetical protein
VNDCSMLASCSSSGCVRGELRREGDERDDVGTPRAHARPGRRLVSSKALASASMSHWSFASVERPARWFRGSPGFFRTSRQRSEECSSQPGSRTGSTRPAASASARVSTARSAGRGVDHDDVRCDRGDALLEHRQRIRHAMTGHAGVDVLDGDLGEARPRARAARAPARSSRCRGPVRRTCPRPRGTRGARSPAALGIATGGLRNPRSSVCTRVSPNDTSRFGSGTSRFVSGSRSWTS